MGARLSQASDTHTAPAADTIGLCSLFPDACFAPSRTMYGMTSIAEPQHERQQTASKASGDEDATHFEISREQLLLLSNSGRLGGAVLMLPRDTQMGWMGGSSHPPWRTKPAGIIRVGEKITGTSIKGTNGGRAISSRPRAVSFTEETMSRAMSMRGGLRRASE